MQQPENQSKKYTNLFNDIDTGRIKLPQFQRDFVWGKEKTAKLIDSIIKGYPIGTFIFWKTREELRSFKNLGNIALPEIPKGDAIMYVLDGQQRITSLYAIRKGIRLTREGKEIDYKDISINLETNPDTDEEIVLLDKPEEKPFISVYKLLNGSLTELLNSGYKQEHLEKIETYQKRLTGYDFSIIVIDEYPIEVACDVFTRINTGGEELTLFEIMVAKTYDLPRNFDLSVEYEKVKDNNNGVEKDLEDAGYETIPPVTILQCIAAILCQQIRRQDVLRINKNDFIDAWKIVISSLFTSVDYLRTEMRIPVSKLLPYHTLLVPLTYFFVKNKNNKPTVIQHKLLTQYFYWASLSNRFSSAVESKVASDLKKIESILLEQMPVYRGEEFYVNIEDLKYKWFSTGDAFCSAILCLYAFCEPKSFESNGIVKLDNSNLKSSSSKNYHHFFPRSYLKKQEIPDWQANSILNITLVDDYLNKRQIKAKAPSNYMRQFIKTNKHINDTMKTHLIDNINEYGILDNNYEKFLLKRGERVIEEINKRLHPDVQM
ncbi:MAG TPA: DUF262 domain-containing protein [Ignavibacteriaceae bacterium]|mgnify:CR=1 FL=1|nr:DUF262 domain-containing protein [Ignavibacteriaceae bacterium]